MATIDLGPEMTETRTALLLPALIVAAGLMGGGWLLGDGLTRAKHADRSVTVRGLAEQDVTADLATWTISTSAVGSDLAALQAKADSDGDAVIAFPPCTDLCVCPGLATSLRSGPTVGSKPPYFFVQL